jgi:ATP synthase protein I
MNEPRADEQAFLDEVRRQARRFEAGRKRSVWRGLAQVGTVGWMISLPCVLGAFVGRWLDDHYHTGLFWTLSLLTAGLASGCYSVWRSIHRELRD